MQEIVKRVPAFMYCLVADENVYKIFGETFVQKFRATGKTLFVKVRSILQFIISLCLSESVAVTLHSARNG